MKISKALTLVVAVTVACSGLIVAGCSKEEEPVNAPPLPGEGKAPPGAEMGTASPMKAPTGPDGGPP